MTTSKTCKIIIFMWSALVVYKTIETNIKRVYRINEKRETISRTGVSAGGLDFCIYV